MAADGATPRDCSVAPAPPNMCRTSWVARLDDGLGVGCDDVGLPAREDKALLRAYMGATTWSSFAGPEPKRA